MSVIGVVLCGGLSTRMGEDKGLKQIRNVRFAEVVYNQLKATVSEVVLSVNKTQINTYNKVFSGFKFAVDLDMYEGPLKGIMSVHKSNPNSDLLIVPCDMIKIESNLLRTLIEGNSAFFNDGRIQPFPLFFKAVDLQNIAKKELTEYSIKGLISFFKQIEISFDNRFFNANSKKDLTDIL